MGGNDLAVVNSESAADVSLPTQNAAAAMDFTREQLDIIRNTVAAGTSDLEFALFIEVARRRRLDPFARQIYAVMRYDSESKSKRMVIQTGIDGYLAIAQRSQEFAGVDDIRFDREDADHPNRATATVYRWSHGQRIPYTYTAFWREYVQVNKDGHPTRMWDRMPYTMLGKCALARALRQGFPEELSGIYTDDEMGQADNPDLDQQLEQRWAESRDETGAFEALHKRATKLGVSEERWSQAKATFKGNTAGVSAWLDKVQHRVEQQAKPKAAKPNPLATLRRRATEVGIASQDDFEDVIADVTGKNDMTALTDGDLAQVSAYLDDLEARHAQAQAALPGYFVEEDESEALP